MTSWSSNQGCLNISSMEILLSGLGFSIMHMRCRQSAVEGTAGKDHVLRFFSVCEECENSVCEECENSVCEECEKSVCEECENSVCEECENSVCVKCENSV